MLQKVMADTVHHPCNGASLAGDQSGLRATREHVLMGLGVPADTERVGAACSFTWLLCEA